MRVNFEDVINYLRDLGDEDIEAHLLQCSEQASYIFTRSVDYLEEAPLIVARFTLLTDETTDITDQSKLAIFIRFVHSDSHEVAEEFLGIVQVFCSKGAEVLCQKVVLLKKVLILNKCASLDSTLLTL